MPPFDRYTMMLTSAAVAHEEEQVRWLRLPGQVCGKNKLKLVLSCRQCGHQVMGGMPPPMT